MRRIWFLFALPIVAVMIYLAYDDFGLWPSLGFFSLVISAAYYLYRQDIRSLNTALRVAGSLPLDGGSPQVDKGVLLFGELSWTPPVVRDLLYLNAFWGIGDYTSAAREPDAGGPVGRTGILFEAYGIGALSAPLGNDARRSAGGALGYQMFLSGIRRQLVIEVGGRRDTLGGTPWAIGGAVRFQQALGRRHVVQIDVAVTESPDTPVTPSVRLEWRMQF